MASFGVELASAALCCSTEYLGVKSIDDALTKGRRLVEYNGLRMILYHLVS